MKTAYRSVAGVIVLLMLFTAFGSAAPNPKALALFQEGQSLIQQGSLEEGKKKLHEAVAIDPTLAIAHNELGVIAIKEDRLDEAVDSFRKAAALPDSPGAALNLTVALIRRNKAGDAEEGIHRVTQFLQKSPRNPDAHKLLSVLYENQGNLDGAISEMKFLTSGPQAGKAALQRLLELQLKKQDRQGALATIARLKAIDPTNEQVIEIERSLRGLMNETPIPQGSPRQQAPPDTKPPRGGLQEKLSLFLPVAAIAIGLVFWLYFKIRSGIDTTSGQETVEIPDFTPEFKKQVTPGEIPERLQRPFTPAKSPTPAPSQSRKTVGDAEKRCFEVVNCPLANRQECAAFAEGLDCWDSMSTACCTKDRTLCIVCPSYTLRLQKAQKSMAGMFQIESANADLMSEIARPEMSLLSGVNKGLGSAANQEELYTVIIDEMIRVSTCREAALFIYDREWEMLKLVKSRTQSEVPLPNFRLPHRGEFKEWISRTTFPVIKKEYEANHFWKAAFPSDARVFLTSHFEIVYLLKTTNTPFMGMVFLGPKISGTLYTKEEKNLMGLVVNLSSEALERVKSYELAIFDGLTNLYVKRYFNERLREEINSARSTLQSCSLILSDIDHFKKFNDTYGHQQGDIVLREVARIIKESLRSGKDVPARYGGEEMAIILPDSECHKGAEVAERIRRSIETHRFPGLPDGVGVTTSFGVAAYPLDADSPDDLVKKADLALYTAKRSGRNQVVLFNESTMK